VGGRAAVGAGTDTMVDRDPERTGGEMSMDEKA